MKKFYCDKCKDEKKEYELTSVKLTVGTVGLYSNGDYAQLELCDECLKELGIAVDRNRKKNIESKSDSDKLYGLIQNIVSDCVSNQ